MTTTDEGAPRPASTTSEVILATRPRRGRRARHSGRAVRETKPASHRKSNRGWLRWLPWVLSAAFVLLLGSGAWVAAQRINVALARPVAHPAALVQTVVPGAAPVLPWAAKGQSAISIPSLGYVEQSGPEPSVPVASLTKITTAIVVLQDHPLPVDAPGPLVTVTADDIVEYNFELQHDQTTVAIKQGETISERQMLEALLTQSANDIAYTLATWDAGSIPAFVVKMNTLAASLGATATHYVDASGYDPQTVSSASDVLRMAAVAMAIPTFAQIVAMTEVTLPVAGTLSNIVSEVGKDGVVGIKSAYTSAAGACMVLAANRTIRGRNVLVMATVLGQPTPPPTMPTTTTTLPPPPKTTTTTTTTTPTDTTDATDPAAPTTTSSSTTTTTTTTTRPRPTTTTTTSLPITDLPIADPFKFARPVVDALLGAARVAVGTVEVAIAGEVMGTMTSTWGGVAHQVPYVTGSGGWLPGWPGQKVVSANRFIAVPPGSRPGTVVGSAEFTIASQIESVPLQLAAVVPEPSAWWRLAHS